MISQQLIDEFQTIIKEDYGKDLSTKEAVQIMENLVGYFDLLAKVCHRKHLQKQNGNNNDKSIKSNN